MSFFSSLFGGPAPSAVTAKDIDLGPFFYTLNYETRYDAFLSGISNRKRAVAELFLFRGWVTQFGFRIVNARPEISRSIHYEIVNLSNTLGRAVLALKHDVKFEQIYRGDFMTLLESRWKQYDAVFQENRTDRDPLAPFAICAAVTAHCHGSDPLKAMLLTTDYLVQLNDIKQESHKRRLLS